MIFIENTIADILTRAVRAGDITTVAESDIYTDDIASSEWKGVNKVYVLRGDSEPVPDMCAESGTSEILESIVTISCLGADKDSSLLLFEEVWQAFLDGLRTDEPLSPVLDWVETDFDAIPRFHNGSFQEQYFQVKTLKIYHLTQFN